jgi:hypothetical protein
MHHHLRTAATFLLATVAAATSALAQQAAEADHPMGQHPAILVQRQAPVIDSNHFIPAHPARLMVIATPTPTYEHPAVVIARLAREAAPQVDYMAQPPVASAWLRRPATTLAATPTERGI